MILNANECSIFSHFDEPRESEYESNSDSDSNSTISIQEHEDPRTWNDIWINGMPIQEAHSEFDSLYDSSEDD